jgi:hypothetical protein
MRVKHRCDFTYAARLEPCDGVRIPGGPRIGCRTGSMLHQNPLPNAPNKRMRPNWIGMVALSFVFVTGAAAQQIQTSLSPDAILGFETTAGWIATGSSMPPGFTISSTATRTQGNAAYAVSYPPNLIKLFSQPVPSTATALTGVGNPGAVFGLDLRIPVEQGNAHNSGWIRLYVNSPSRGLNNVALAQIFLNGHHAGIYNTLRFPIPDGVRTALGGAPFNDLTFEFEINSPGQVTGSYFLDNLRVHSPPTNSAKPPAGYGGSVDLEAIGDTPATSTFAAEVVQVPGDFVFTKPTDTSSPSLRLDLGYDGTPSFTCSYIPDPSDNTNMHFLLISCTNGMQAGDLVGASWARLAILNGYGKGKIRAQLATNPVSDLTGRGIIPPMPTFWGGFNGCTPAPSTAPTGTPVTLSTSCNNQVSRTNQIASKYLESLNTTTSYDWVVTPTKPDFAIRHGDGMPNNNLTGPPPPNDPPFDDEGHLNMGGDWDGYWRLSGDLTSSQAAANSDEGKTHFNAALGVHAVAWGYDVDVVDVKGVLDTDTGRTAPLPTVSPSASGTLEVYLFGLLTRHYSADPSTAFNVNVAGLDDEVSVATVPIWIFTIELKVSCSAGINASGGVTGAGPSVSFGPSAAVEAHLIGGISIGIASGGVDAEVDLIRVGTPLVVNAKWTSNNDPRVCALTVTYSLKGQVQFSALGGEIDLIATFGPCPFCYKESETIFSWAPVATTNANLFDVENSSVDWELPSSLCTKPLTVAIDAPAANATLSSNIPLTLAGHATGNAGGVPCSAWNWTFTKGTNASSVSPTAITGSCSPVVEFGPPTSGASSNWTINLNVSIDYKDKFGRTITESGSANTPVTVGSLTNGAYILEMTDSSSNVYTVINGAIGLNDPGPSTSPYSATFTFYGTIVGAAGTTSTVFSASNGSITTGNGSTSAPTGTWTVSAVPTVIGGTTYYSLPTPNTITMTAKNPDSSTFGTATVTVNFSSIQ